MVKTKVENIQEVEENKKVLHHFAIFAIVDELLIIIAISPAYCLMQACDEMRPLCNQGVDAQRVVYRFVFLAYT